LNICTSYVLVFGCLRGQDVIGLKYQKRRLFGVNYGVTFHMSAAAGIIFAQNRPKYLNASWIYFG